MKATSWEFRWRYLLHGVIYALGFTTPWYKLLRGTPLADPAGPNSHIWGLLAANLAMALHNGAGGITTAFNVLLGVAIVCAVLGAWLRTWGGAYLGEGVAQDDSMHGQGVVADGPYRYLRNPLYVGTFLHTLALALLMPRSGAVFAIVLIGIFQVRLMLAEEAFLRPRLGASYAAYCERVPRIMPALTPRTAASGRTPHWGAAFLGEVYFWGVAATYAFLGWRYNAFPMIQGIVISLGLGMIARVLIPKPAQPTQ